MTFYIETLEKEQGTENCKALKKRISRVIARNLTAWDTSKDKTEGLLPEVYLTNKRIYKELTGKEYYFNDAVKIFQIG